MIWTMSLICLDPDETYRKTNKYTVSRLILIFLGEFGGFFLVFNKLNQFGSIFVRVECNFLGIWADDSDNEEKSSRQSTSRHRKPKDYTAPIGFVAGGVQQSGKKKETDKKDDASDNSEPENGKKRI